jgi:hypothetical protein
MFAIRKTIASDDNNDGFEYYLIRDFGLSKKKKTFSGRFHGSIVTGCPASLGGNSTIIFGSTCSSKFRLIIIGTNLICRSVPFVGAHSSVFHSFSVTFRSGSHHHHHQHSTLSRNRKAQSGQKEKHYVTISNYPQLLILAFSL